MRTFPCCAAGCLAVIAAAAVAAAALLPRATMAKDVMEALSLAELREKLDETDRANALGAVQLALSQIGDGQAYVWRNAERQFTGVVRPTATFRDGRGQICRHVVVQLSLGQYRKSIEGIACRKPSGLWSLSG